MKPSIPNLTDHELDRLACLESSHIYTASIRINADDRRTCSLATGHYIDRVVEANAPPERLVLRAARIQRGIVMPDEYGDPLAFEMPVWRSS